MYWVPFDFPFDTFRTNALLDPGTSANESGMEVDGDTGLGLYPDCEQASFLPARYIDVD